MANDHALACEVYARRLQDCPSLELYLGYGDALAKCGRLSESLDVYAHCGPPASQHTLRHVTHSLLEAVAELGDRPKTAPAPALGCAVCDSVFRKPVTLPCGHTFCRKCVQGSKTCSRCAAKVPAELETNVLVRSLVEKWWAGELEVSRLRDQGNQLFASSQLEAALLKYDAAVSIAPDNHLVLSNRSHALYRLNRLQAALLDADHVIKLRPQWGKGHYRRALALSALGRFDESLLSFSLCVALDKNAQAVKHEVTKVIHRLLTECTNRHKKNKVCLVRRSPSYTISPLSRATLNTSDCEDNSSGEEDILQLQVSKDPLVPALPIQNNRKLRFLLERIFQEVEKVKRVEVKPVDILLPVDLVEQSDFDCVLCCRTLWRPITTPCGHTYCRMCLERCLDYSSACPLCMTSLIDYLATSEKHENQFIEQALLRALPSVYASRLLLHSQELVALERAPDVPVFVCTTSFPSVPCPLFVFEPRYRLMVRRCVESKTRQFAIAACLHPNAGIKRYAEYGTMLEIKDWILLNDGCSILTTVGVRRFRVISRAERDGYDTARIQYLRDIPITRNNLPEITELHERVLAKANRWFGTIPASTKAEIWRTFGTMPVVEEDWADISDGPAWAWWLLAILPLGQQLQVGILGTTSLAKRLRAIDKTLDHVSQQFQPQVLAQPHTILPSISHQGSLRREPMTLRLT